MQIIDDQLRQLAPNVLTKIIQMDFDGASDLQTYQNLAKNCADLDVSIVIANAGVMIVGDFINFPSEKSQSMLDVNAYHYVMIHKTFLPMLRKRMLSEGKRCALIGVSSSSWLRHFPKFTVYTATKAFVSYLSQALQREKGL